MSEHICNDLIEAYKGYYEDEYMYGSGEYSADPEKELTEWVVKKILADSPKERLKVYLEWNGILGYTNRIWEISLGEIYAA